MKHDNAISILIYLLTMMLCSGLIHPVVAQEHPPKPVTLTTSQNMSFGAFAVGTFGGTVSVSSSGVRTSTGDIILVNLGTIYAPAHFEADVNPGTIVSLVLGPDVTLTGSNGGSMLLHLQDPTPGYSFVTWANPPATTQISIGGTLTVGSTAANPPGAYSGSFLIIVNQE